VVTFKRGVYASALRHLAPFARHIAGQQAIPQLRPEARPRPPERRQSGQRGRGG
jgi:putative (di)nucleoside polyphosphate hydrolase